MNLQRISAAGGTGHPSGGIQDGERAARAAPRRASAPENAVEPTLGQLKSALGEINDTVHLLDIHVEFVIDEQANRTVVKVVDTRTNDVIREFPAGKVLGLARALGHVRGMLLHDKV